MAVLQSSDCFRGWFGGHRAPTGHLSMEGSVAMREKQLELPFIFHHKHGQLTVHAPTEDEAKKRAIRLAQGMYVMTDKEYKELRSD